MHDSHSTKALSLIATKDTAAKVLVRSVKKQHPQYLLLARFVPLKFLTDYKQNWIADIARQASNRSFEMLFI
jgi:hypothetical protein